MMTGLFPRDGRYSGKVVVPVDLQHAYAGKKVIVRALKTADYAEAKRLNLAFRVEMDAAFQAKRAELKIKSQPVQAPSQGYWGTMSREQFDYEMESIAHFSAEEAREEHEYEEREAARARYEALSTAPLDTLSQDERALRDVLDDLKFDLRLAKERLAVAPVNEGQGSLPAEASRSVRPSGPARAEDRGVPARAAATPTLAQVAAKWAERQKNRRTIGRTLQIVADFEGVAGVRPVSDYGREHVVAYRDWLVEQGKTVANINVLVPMLGTVFFYAVKKLHVIGASPTTGMGLDDNRKASSKRRGFTEAELEAFFGSEIYRDDLRPEAGGGEAAYWLPLLALYTGGRETELGQLYTDDIYEERYYGLDGSEERAWVVRFVENEERGQRVKNQGSERRVPIHPSLVELGFLKLVAERHAPGGVRLFPHIHPNSIGELMGNWSKWFGRYRRAKCGLTGKDPVFHSFRHSFKHYARVSLISKEVHHALTGHETGESGDDYGLFEFPIGPLVEGVQRYRVPGFTLPAPPPAFR